MEEQALSDTVENTVEVLKSVYRLWKTEKETEALVVARDITLRYKRLVSSIAEMQTVSEQTVEKQHKRLLVSTQKVSMHEVTLKTIQAQKEKARINEKQAQHALLSAQRQLKSCQEDASKAKSQLKNACTKLEQSCDEQKAALTTTAVSVGVAFTPVGLIGSIFAGTTAVVSGVATLAIEGDIQTLKAKVRENNDAVKRAQMKKNRASHKAKEAKIKLREEEQSVTAATIRVANQNHIVAQAQTQLEKHQNIAKLCQIWRNLVNIISNYAYIGGQSAKHISAQGHKLHIDKTKSLMAPHFQTCAEHFLKIHEGITSAEIRPTCKLRKMINKLPQRCESLMKLSMDKTQVIG